MPLTSKTLQTLNLKSCYFTTKWKKFLGKQRWVNSDNAKTEIGNGFVKRCIYLSI